MTYTAVNPHACCNWSRPKDAHAAARQPPHPHASPVKMRGRTIFYLGSPVRATAMKWKAVDVDLTQGFIQAELPKDGKAIYISLPPGHVEEPEWYIRI